MKNIEERLRKIAILLQIEKNQEFSYTEIIGLPVIKVF